jgi:sterol desaturase/sphingolipid hydroxylase (fatty acid hydroxylase superfamily)
MGGHRIHHQYQRHEANYSDIVWWDMLFGTYENPHRVESRCGFDDAREQRLVEMLAFRDVHGDVCSANPMTARTGHGAGGSSEHE